MAGCSAQQVRSLSPLALAYVGDAVFELFVRSRLLVPPQQVRTFHQQVVGHVRAEQQADYLECLRPHLSDEEKDILRRARNATSGRKVRASRRDYQQATALEALLGYLYLTDSQRLMEILAYLPISPETLPTASP
ncbi:MAG: Mini-ribonuclease 3 [Leptolyngbya sp. SIOISBB]|nr:Mini-ribonuclease 3 [Leptolyngbya sp. SIOISBB]